MIDDAVLDDRDTRLDLAGRLRTEVAERLSQTEGTSGPLRRGGDAERMLARRLLEDALAHEAQARAVRLEDPLSPDAEEAVTRDVLDALFGLGPLQRYLDDERITDIHAQGFDRVFVVYADGTKERVGPIAKSDDDLVDLVRLAGSRMSRTEQRFDAGSPELNLELPDGSRLFAVMNVSRRPSLAIRRHRYLRVSLADLVGMGTLDERLASFLSAAVRARRNMLISGGTSMGKTTLLRALLNEVPAHERIVTIEDAAELGLDRDEAAHPDVVSLEERRSNVEGQGAVPMERLVRMALRMDPDRVIVGEVRGDEVIPMLNAMSQGNDGSMGTIHADSSEGAFKRLALYAVQAPERLPLAATNQLVANAVDFVVHLSRDLTAGYRGARYVASIREVVDADELRVSSNEVFALGPEGRAVPATPVRTSTLQRLTAAGLDPAVLSPVPSWE